MKPYIPLSNAEFDPFSPKGGSTVPPAPLMNVPVTNPSQFVYELPKSFGNPYPVNIATGAPMYSQHGMSMPAMVSTHPYSNASMPYNSVTSSVPYGTNNMHSMYGGGMGYPPPTGISNYQGVGVGAMPGLANPKYVNNPPVGGGVHVNNTPISSAFPTPHGGGVNSSMNPPFNNPKLYEDPFSTKVVEDPFYPKAENPFNSTAVPDPFASSMNYFDDPFASRVAAPLPPAARPVVVPPPPPKNKVNASATVENALAVALQDLHLSGVNILWEELVVKESIGVGGFAEVFLGLYKGVEVGIKRLRVSNMTARAIQDFKSEVSFMKTLRHPNILLFMGVCVKPVCLITEYCRNGNLFDVLHGTNSVTDFSAPPEFSIALSWSLKLKLAMDAARGINFLHTSDPPIIHRDLKSLNLLIDDTWTLKVADFGLSRFRASTDSVLMTGQCGTFQWMAPEVISSQIYSEKADVYSFGINLWEIYTRSTPFDGLQPLQVALAVSTQNKRPPVPADMPPWYSHLMVSCWHQNAASRPSFAEIIRILKVAGPPPPPTHL